MDKRYITLEIRPQQWLKECSFFGNKINFTIIFIYLFIKISRKTLFKMLCIIWKWKTGYIKMFSNFGSVCKTSSEQGMGQHLN